MAFDGVVVEGCTLANQDGTSRALPITQRYLAWPNIATKREATIPKLAPNIYNGLRFFLIRHCFCFGLDS